MRRPTKACPFCETRVRFVDYKDERTLGRFITDHGKILPSRLSGVCARHQRQLSTAIKRAPLSRAAPVHAGSAGLDGRRSGSGALRARVGQSSSSRSRRS
jgi:small subunit ribosomal protein S18